MRVLGLDPGSRKLGYGVVERSAGRWRRVDGGIIRLETARPLSQRLVTVHGEVTRIISACRPDLVAIEEVFVARSARAALILGQVRGVLLLAVEQSGLALCELAARKVKLAAVGNGGAAKEQIQYMVPRLLDDCPSAVAEDEADALAIAWCGANQVLSLR